eukprot:g2435.t1
MSFAVSSGPRWHSHVKRELLPTALRMAGFALGAKVYNPGDKVEVQMNTVGPYNNPDELYPYYSLPFCRPNNSSTSVQVHNDLGHALAGDAITSSALDIRFGVEVRKERICRLKYGVLETQKMRKAVRAGYVLEFFVDELPVLAELGSSIHQEAVVYMTDEGAHRHNDTHIYLYTHMHLSIAYNGNHIIAVNVSQKSDNMVSLEFQDEDRLVEFTYSTAWFPVQYPVEDRLSYHSRALIQDQPLKVHWMAIANSMSLVALLTAWTAVQLQRFIKRDLSRYLDKEDLESDPAEEENETGWKLVAGDVFRFPPYPLLFSSLVGAGTQMLYLAVSLIVFSLFGAHFGLAERGHMYELGLVVYALTAGLGSARAMKLYRSFFESERDFVRKAQSANSVILTSLLIPGPFLLVFSVSNSVAWYHGSTTALPGQVVAGVLLYWTLVVLPLAGLGAWLTRRQPHEKLTSPCKTNISPREIPEPRWYNSWITHWLLSGLLPLCTSYTEIYYILASIWGHRVFTLYGILAVAFVLLLAVSAITSIIFTYLGLNAEDYRWWWKTQLGGAASGLFLYIAACAYYLWKSDMSGVIQATHFFGYSLFLSFCYALMLSALNFHVSLRFVRHIYSSIKID